MNTECKRFLLCWVIRLGAFFLPVLPMFLFLREINCIWIGPLFCLVAATYVSPFWFRWIGQWHRVENVTNVIQILLAWLPFFYFLYYWLLTFPELKWVIVSSLLFILTSFRMGRLNQPISLGRLLAHRCLRQILSRQAFGATLPGPEVGQGTWLKTGVFGRPTFRMKCYIVPLLFLCMPLLYNVSLIYAGLYLAGIGGVMAATLYLHRRHSLGLPLWVPIILFSTYGSVLSVVAHVYTCDQRDLSEKIACQDGIEPISPLDYADLSRNPDLPFHDISSFCVTGDGRLILLPRHQDQMICMKKGRNTLLFETKGEFTDNLILDWNRRYAYFAAGENLWRTSLGWTAIKRLHRFDATLINDPPGIEPNYVRANPNPALKQLLVQYDVDNGVFVYDFEKDRSRRVPSPYMLIESIWHPGGTKIIGYGIDRSSAMGHFVIMDLQGNMLAHRPLIPFDDISLTPTTSDEFLAAFFHRGKVERLSVNTLETSWTLAFDEGTPRAVLESEAHGCLLVPSYARGTLSLYRTKDKILLRRLLIGKRVRAITPAFNWSRYWISSSAGLFSMDLTEVLKGSHRHDP